MRGSLRHNTRTREKGRFLALQSCSYVARRWLGVLGRGRGCSSRGRLLPFMAVLVW